MGEMMATEWTSSRIEEMIRERYEALLPEMPRQQERWGQSRETSRAAWPSWWNTPARGPASSSAISATRWG